MNKRKGRIFACSDLHGYLDLYNQIKKFLRPEDKVYFLGDAGDRGPQCWETLKTILCDPQFIYIKGNHDQMLIDAAREYWRDDEMYGDRCDLLFYNGGEATLSGLIREEKPQIWISELNKKPVFDFYENKDGKYILMSHAGFTPNLQGFTALGAPILNLPEDYDLIWDRDHLDDVWPEDPNYNNLYILHGHTSVEHILGHNPAISCYPAFYAEGHKIDIDLATYRKQITVLLDLDTFEYHRFATN